jgi:hypothetical protein
LDDDPFLPPLYLTPIEDQCFGEIVEDSSSIKLTEAAVVVDVVVIPFTNKILFLPSEIELSSLEITTISFAYKISSKIKCSAMSGSIVVGESCGNCRRAYPLFLEVDICPPLTNNMPIDSGFLAFGRRQPFHFHVTEIQLEKI